MLDTLCQEQCRIIVFAFRKSFYSMVFCEIGVGPTTCWLPLFAPHKHPEHTEIHASTRRTTHNSITHPPAHPPTHPLACSHASTHPLTNPRGMMPPPPTPSPTAQGWAPPPLGSPAARRGTCARCPGPAGWPASGPRTARPPPLRCPLQEPARSGRIARRHAETHLSTSLLRPKNLNFIKTQMFKWTM